MLFRDVGDDEVIGIPQPAHAWLAGQIVRAWGNGAFPPPEPREEVCLGAALHDIGWLDWEASPTLDPATGRPREFRTMGAHFHARHWTRGVREALAVGRYPALLVSLHADEIERVFGHLRKPDEAEVVAIFLDAQHAFQRSTIDSLAADPRYADHVTPEALERNRLIVGTADRLSLAICWGVRDEAEVLDAPRGPGAGDRVALRLRSPGGDPGRLTLDPWPFAADRVDLACDGVRLRGRHTDEVGLRQALDDAPRATIAVTLSPA